MRDVAFRLVNPTLLSMLRRNRTPPALGRVPKCLRVLVIDKQLAVLSETSRLLASDLDHVKSALESADLLENLVHFFERAVSRLRIEAA